MTSPLSASPTPTASTTAARPAPTAAHPAPAPSVPTGGGKPGDDQICEARRTVAQHRRRRHPDTRFCGLCGQRWHIDRTLGGRPARGCARRRQALDVLESAGQLDDAGRPVVGTGA